MPGTKNANEIARNLLIGVAILLVVGIAGSVYMGARARNTAIKTTVDQATEIADNSLGLVFRPEDLAAPVPCGARHGPHDEDQLGRHRPEQLRLGDAVVPGRPDPLLDERTDREHARRRA